MKLVFVVCVEITDLAKARVDRLPNRLLDGIRHSEGLGKITCTAGIDAAVYKTTN